MIGNFFQTSVFLQGLYRTLFPKRFQLEPSQKAGTIQRTPEEPCPLRASFSVCVCVLLKLKEPKLTSDLVKANFQCYTTIYTYTKRGGKRNVLVLLLFCPFEGRKGKKAGGGEGGRKEDTTDSTVRLGS